MINEINFQPFNRITKIIVEAIQAMPEEELSTTEKELSTTENYISETKRK